MSCLGRRHAQHIKKKACISLHRKINKLKRERMWSGSFAVLQTSATVIMVVVVAAGGPGTLIVSVILTTAGALYQMWDYYEKGREIQEIEAELSKRDDAEVRLVSVGTVPVSTPRIITDEESRQMEDARETDLKEYHGALQTETAELLRFDIRQSEGNDPWCYSD